MAVKGLEKHFWKFFFSKYLTNLGKLSNNAVVTVKATRNLPEVRI
jgi:hypothetical protein